MEISSLDANFKVQNKINEEDAVFLDVLRGPFSVHGVIYEDGRFRRMPAAVADNVSEGVKGLNDCTAGGRVRFITDSPYVAVHAEYCSVGKMPHFPLTGSVGLDLYADGMYRGTFMPPFDITDTLDGVVYVGGGEKTCCVNMPTYSSVKRLYIGLKEGCSLKKAPDYGTVKPVVFYGSSITQAGCCSRPGCSYQQILSDRLGFDYVNLGFSGNAKGEIPMAEYIASLPMSAFVYDYDHNAPDTGHLAATHERMFRIIREKQPGLPVLMLSRPKKHLSEDETRRLKIVEKTYLNAVAAGDKNVYFIPGDRLLSDADAEYALVDNTHPNDIGFMNMANAIAPVMKIMLGTED